MVDVTDVVIKHPYIPVSTQGAKDGIGFAFACSCLLPMYENNDMLANPVSGSSLSFIGDAIDRMLCGSLVPPPHCATPAAVCCHRDNVDLPVTVVSRDCGSDSDGSMPALVSDSDDSLHPCDPVSDSDSEDEHDNDIGHNSDDTLIYRGRVMPNDSLTALTFGTLIQNNFRDLTRPTVDTLEAGFAWPLYVLDKLSLQMAEEGSTYQPHHWQASVGRTALISPPDLPIPPNIFSPDIENILEAWGLL
jgi:hypothetical protein